MRRCRNVISGLYNHRINVNSECTCLASNSSPLGVLTAMAMTMPAVPSLLPDFEVQVPGCWYFLADFSFPYRSERLPTHPSNVIYTLFHIYIGISLPPPSLYQGFFSLYFPHPFIILKKSILIVKVPNP